MIKEGQRGVLGRKEGWLVGSGVTQEDGLRPRVGDPCETCLVHRFSFLICEMGTGSSNVSGMAVMIRERSHVWLEAPVAPQHFLSLPRLPPTACFHKTLLISLGVSDKGNWGGILGG